MIKHGVQEEEKQHELEKRTAKYVAILNIPENTLNEIFEKYSALAVENPDDVRAWNILKLFVLKYDGQIECVKDMKYKKYIDLLRNQVIDYEAYVRTQDDLSFKGIQVNCKSYAVWNHRVFLNAHINKERDIKLCEMLLKLDSRNFHCWNYCRKFGYDIKINVDNYSAIVHREKLCPSKLIVLNSLNKAYWQLLEKKMFFDNFLQMEVKGSCINIVFSTLFKGKLLVFGETHDVKENTLFLKINVDEKTNIGERIDLRLNETKFVCEKIKEPEIIGFILKNEPNNPHAKSLKKKMSTKKYFVSVDS